MRVFPLVSLAMLSCASLSPSVKQQLRASQSLEVVRAPTPTIRISTVTGKRMSLFRMYTQPIPVKAVEVNVTTLAGGPDPAELLRVAVARRLTELGYRPASSASALVRFESPAQRWPRESGVSADWVLHAQIDAVGLDADNTPRDVKATATLFHEDGVQLRTTCSAHADWQEGEAMVIDLLEHCAKELLTPFED